MGACKLAGKKKVCDKPTVYILSALCEEKQFQLLQFKAILRGAKNKQKYIKKK